MFLTAIWLLLLSSLLGTSGRSIRNLPREVTHPRPKQVSSLLSRLSRYSGDGVTLPITNHGGTILTANITIGTPPLLCRLMVDFVLGEAWVAGPKLWMPGKAPYEPTRSSTYRNVSQPFDSEVASGESASDVFSITSNTGVVQQFGLADDITDKFLNYMYQYLEFDGYLGLSPAARTQSRVDSFLWNMIRAERSPFVTVWLEPYKPPSPAGISSRGEITFGGTNRRQCFTQGWFSTPQVKLYTGTWAWAWHLDSVSVINGRKKATEPHESSQRTLEGSGAHSLNQTAVFAPFIYGENYYNFGPKKALDYIAHRIGARYGGGLYVLNCNESSIDTAKIVFRLNGGSSFQIALKDLVASTAILPVPQEGVCVLLMATTPKIIPVDWLMGTSFLSRHCMMLDVKKHTIAFTKAFA